MYPLLLVNFFFIDNVNNVYTVDAVNDTYLTRQFITARRTGFYQQRCNQRPLFLNTYLNLTISFWISRLSAGYIKIIVEPQSTLAVDQFYILSLDFEACDSTGLFINSQNNSFITQFCAQRFGTTICRRKSRRIDSESKTFCAQRRYIFSHKD